MLPITPIWQEATQASRKFAAEADTEDRKNIEAAGYAKIVDLTKAERAAWKKASMPVWDQFKGEIGADLIKEITALLEK